VTATDTETATEDLMMSFEWTDANANVLGSTDTLDLSVTTLSVGDTVTCTATVDDGNLQSQDSTSAAIVAQ
jgi:hypothetical protein